MHACWRLVPLILVMALIVRAEGINPKDHRAEIRAALLQATPLGSTPAQVLTFITKQLLKGEASAPILQDHPAKSLAAGESPKRGVRSISLPLGQYLDNPALIILSAPLMTEKEVTAEWAFDKENRLIEIFVDKKTATY